MNTTLKSNYKNKIILERIKKLDNVIINENKIANLLLEEMNPQDLQKANDIINKLRKIKGKGIKSLDNAIEDAETELNKYVGGGTLTQAWTKLKAIAGFNNPLVKVMTFANTLETGFKQVPTIIRNNVDVDLNANLEKTLNDLVQDTKKKKNLINNMIKSLSPNGIFSSFKIPYINKEIFVNDLLNVPIKVFAEILRNINSGPNTSQIATDIKDVAQQHGTSNINTRGTDTTKSTSGSSGTEVSKQTISSKKTKETGDIDTNVNVADSVYKQLHTQLADIADERKIKDILKLLAHEDKLKT